MCNNIIGIIGGNAVNDASSLTNKHWQRIDSPFGEASDELVLGQHDGQHPVFLPR
jgi:5'-methylthioadenosine phosphorylase